MLIDVFIIICKLFSFLYKRWYTYKNVCNAMHSLTESRRRHADFIDGLWPGGAPD